MGVGSLSGRWWVELYSLEATSWAPHWRQSSDKLRLLGKVTGEAAQWGEIPDCAPHMEPVGEAC